MTPHPEYLRGIQAVIDHLVALRDEPGAKNVAVSLYTIVDIVREFKHHEQSTPPAVADQEGGKEL